MNANVRDVMEECTRASDEERVTFGEVVMKLIEAGVERYHADLLRAQKTYFLPNDESLVVAGAPVAGRAPSAFSAAGVEAAVRAIQGRAIQYQGVLRAHRRGRLRRLFRVARRTARRLLRAHRRDLCRAVPRGEMTGCVRRGLRASRRPFGLPGAPTRRRLRRLARRSGECPRGTAGGGDMNLKRRGFLAAGASAMAFASLPGRAAAPPAGEHYPVGDFILTHANRGLRVAHRRKPDRIIWESARDGNFIIAERASATIKEFGAPEGTFEITDAVAASYEQPTIEAIEAAGGAATVSGALSGPAGATVRYTLAFEAVSSTHLRFVIRAHGPQAAGVNRIRLLIGSALDEAIFGCGEQLTDFNQKGNVLPILVQEHGIGRGRPVITELVNLFDHNSGGDPTHTGAPAPHFITSRLRSLFLENLEYSVFDMRQADHIDIKVWSATMTGRILYGETPLDLIETYTEYAGRMRVLPDWVHNGAILGLMGGTDAVRAKLGRARAADVPVAGLWLQDWVGVRTTFAGTQLWWNWALDEAYYPRWPELVADVERDGGRVLLYINPYLATEEGHNQLFTQAREKGYLVRKADGAPYLIRNSSFYVGMLDLSHPQAREWIKAIIKTNMIGAAGAAGWMNDFGEALPFDAKLLRRGRSGGLAQSLRRRMVADQSRGDRGERRRRRNGVLRPRRLHPKSRRRHFVLAWRPIDELGRL